jgi:hypothetical protein
MTRMATNVDDNTFFHALPDPPAPPPARPPRADFARPPDAAAIPDVEGTARRWRALQDTADSF